MENQSQYDPTRKTVGTIYRDAKMNNHETHIEVGDMRNELMSSLVEDLHEVLNSKPYGGDKEYYICIHESKDLAMPNMIKRRMLTTLYRPYPEDDTVVFRVHPTTKDVYFCWCLPHWTEMDNILASSNLYDDSYVFKIRKWKNLELEHFGFIKIGEGDKWDKNPNWTFEKDHKLQPVITKPKVTILGL